MSFIERRAVPCLLLVLFLLILSTPTYAAEGEEVVLKTFTANSGWYFSCAEKDKSDPEPSIGQAGNGTTCTINFGMQYNCYLGEMDMAQGTPTKIAVTYAEGASGNELINWNQIYVVLGENENDIAGRWWAGPWSVRSTGSWDTFTTQTFSIKPGGSWEWPEDTVKVWLHNSRVADLHVSQVTLIGIEKMPEGDGDGTAGAGDAGTAGDNGGGTQTGQTAANNDTAGTQKENVNRAAEKSEKPTDETSQTQSNSSVKLSRISLDGKQGDETGSVGGGTAKEQPKSLMIFDLKDKMDLSLKILLCAAVVLFLLGGVGKFLQFKNQMAPLKPESRIKN